MWLLDTVTLELRDFVGANIPSYAILSHTWGPGEVDFKDMRKHREAARLKAGYEKVQKCCEKARQDGHQYMWVDTCCIDKRSSAELSEAINTMYRWYQDSAMCYVYLADVPSEGLSSRVKHDDSFSKSRWFTRGWTLQELIAPRNIQFLGQDWRVIGIKAPLTQGSRNREQHEMFLSKLAKITGIDMQIFRDPSSVRARAAAQKMAWASSRQTTREEDLAYSLMGLFDVSMPILYGEGLKKAFRRLQLEIIQKTADQSIFVWRANRPRSGLLADSPRDFADSGLRFVRRWPTTRPFSMTNMGLLVNLPLIRRDEFQYTLALECWVRDVGEPQRVGLFLHKLLHPAPADTVYSDQTVNEIFRRELCEELEVGYEESSMNKSENIYILEDEHLEHLRGRDIDFYLESAT